MALTLAQDSPQSIELCIEGFKHCIRPRARKRLSSENNCLRLRIAARFDMDTERDAFVSSLAKFTYLTTIKVGLFLTLSLFLCILGDEAKEH